MIFAKTPINAPATAIIVSRGKKNEFYFNFLDILFDK